MSTTNKRKGFAIMMYLAANDYRHLNNDNECGTNRNMRVAACFCAV